MTFLMYTLHVLICFFLIAVVLLQQGKGADLSVFGGGGTQTAFGARGAATVLHKMTVGSFIAFIITTMAIGVLQTEDEGSGVLGGLPETTEQAPAEPEPEGALPASEDDAAATDEDAADSAEPAADTPDVDTPDGEGDSPDAEASDAETSDAETEAPAAEESGSEEDDASQGEG